MDDSTQQQSIVQEAGPIVKPVPNRGGIPVVPPVITPPVPVAPPVPQQPVSSSGSKESGPIAQAPVPDVTLMTEDEIQSEEKDVEKKLEALISESPNPQQPKLTQEVKAAGVELAKETALMPTTPSGKVVLPMTYEEALLTRKKYKWKDSFAWFAALLVYHWKRVNFGNKKEK